MPRRSLLSQAERELLFAFPTDDSEMNQYYTFSEHDLSFIRQHRTPQNKLGFAVQICYLRYPGYALPPDGEPPYPLLQMIAKQINLDSSAWPLYSTRPETRREHLLELQTAFGYRPFSGEDYKAYLRVLVDLALQTDKGIFLATSLFQELRKQKIIIPPIDVIEKLCAEALSQGTNQIYTVLTESLTDIQRQRLDELLDLKPETRISHLTWLKQPPNAPNAKHILEHIDRLKLIKSFVLDDELQRQVHQNRLLKIAREGEQMTAQHLRDLGTVRRYATLVAILLESQSTLIDEIVDIHDRIIGTLFNRAKHNHAEKFQSSGRSINEKVRLYWRIGQALLDAKSKGTNPFEALEAIIPWEDFTKSVEEAHKLSQDEDFDYLYLIGNSYSQVRRYAPSFLDALVFKATPSAQELLNGVEIIKKLNDADTRSVPKDAPTGFIRKRWQNLVFVDGTIDRKYYELCILTELKNVLRSGDIWIKGSRQFKDFEEYLIPKVKYIELFNRRELPLAVDIDNDIYLKERFSLLENKLKNLNELAGHNQLQDATITESGLKISPLINAVPDEADTLMRQTYALLPHLKITELLLEVDNWTGFTNLFTHIKTGESAKDRILLLTTILADGLNLGLRKMSESCENTTFAKLSWLQAWYIRDETYSSALANLVNAQSQQPLASFWGDGTKSSSDGQRFRAGGYAEAGGGINPKYGSEPGVQFYTHISDQYAPFHTKVIAVGVRDATHVLDGLLYNESDLRIEEHYTDTAGFTDHVFALMHLLGFRFAPRIRDLADKKLYVPGNQKSYPSLTPLIGGNINKKLIEDHWDEILRLGTSIKQGTVTASLMLRKLGSYPRQNGLALALREFGRIERTLFTMDWIQDLELRRRVQVGLNKGEAKNALSRAVFFNRLGEIRDRNIENQQYRASGLNIVVSAIILWNTVYLGRAISALKERGYVVDDNLLQYLSPLGWEHINLTGDYTWQQNKLVKQGSFRPLQPIT